VTESDGERTWRVEVSADKPGRHVVVSVGQGEIAAGATVRDLAPWIVQLEIAPSHPITDPWTWLTLDEARQLAEVLTEAAATAARRNAQDPRDQGGVG
jgi:hypothetical protein